MVGPLPVHAENSFTFLIAPNWSRDHHWLAWRQTCNSKALCIICEEDRTGKFLVLFRFLSIPAWMKNYTIGILDLEWLETVLVFLPAGVFYSGIFSYIGSKGYTIASAIRKGDTQKALHSFSGFEFAIVGVTGLVAVLILIFGWCEYASRRAAMSEGKRAESAPLALVAKPIV